MCSSDLVILNVVMVASHLPSVFNSVMAHPAMMNWVVEPSFLLSGWWFFGGLISAPYRQVRTRLSRQLLAVVATMAEMLIMAMSMSIFTKSPWYQMGGAMGPMNMSFASQQLAAAILWICGDFWGCPSLSSFSDDSSTVTGRYSRPSTGGCVASSDSRPWTLAR